MIKNRYIIENEKIAFTLVELIVSITIFIIIIISVMTLFISSNDISSKTDINRFMQENIKNIVENISEDIRKYGIKGVSNGILNTCDITLDLNSNVKKGNKLCTGMSEYYLAKKNLFGTYDRVLDIGSECNELSDTCILVKKGPLSIDMLSNSFVTFRELSFNISDDSMKKVSINFVMKPSTGKGVKSNLIKSSEIIFQTTITEKLIKTN